jgi:AmmeMemoRadiSam system protein B
LKLNILLVLAFFGVVFSQNLVEEYCAENGLFPSDPTVLWDQITDYINMVKPRPLRGNIIGILVPEESYLFSGTVIGAAYNLASQERKKLIVVIVEAPPGQKGVSIMKFKYFKTPLGTQIIDSTLVKKISERIPKIKLVDECPPKSFWFQLPFTQYSFRSTPLIVFLVGKEDDNVLDGIANSCSHLFSEYDPLIVNVSNLAKGEDAREVTRTFRSTMVIMTAMMEKVIVENFETGKYNLSNPWGSAFSIKLVRALGADTGIVVKGYVNSGFPTAEICGIASIAWIDVRKTYKSHNTLALETINDKDRDLLLKYIYNILIGQNPPVLPRRISNLRCGVFITIKIDDKILVRNGDLFSTRPFSETAKSLCKSLKYSLKHTSSRRRTFENATLVVGLTKIVEGVEEPSPDLGIYIRQGTKDGIVMPWEDSDISPSMRLDRVCMQAGILSKSWCDSETDVYYFIVKAFEKEISLDKIIR